MPRFRHRQLRRQEGGALVDVAKWRNVTLPLGRSCGPKLEAMRRLRVKRSSLCMVSEAS